MNETVIQLPQQPEKASPGKSAFPMTLATVWRGLLFIVLLLCGLIPFHEQLSVEWPSLKAFSITFVSIVLEAMPFVILGAIIGGLIEVFISADLLGRWVPKNPILRLLLPAAGGLILPVCECAVVPVMRRLLKKGLPFSSALAYLLAAPIVNPLVLASTSLAYRGNQEMVIWRGVGGYVVAVLVALILGRLIRKEITIQVETDVNSDHSHSHSHSHDHDHSHSHSHSHDLEPELEHDSCSNKAAKPKGLRLGGRIASAMSHAADDFLMVGMYLVIGSLLASVIHTNLNRASLVDVAGSDVIASLMMMGMALGLNLCSEADAFIAASFRYLLPFSAQLAFLVLGPMMDLKLAAMYLTFMTRKAMIVSVITICMVVFALAMVSTLITS